MSSYVSITDDNESDLTLATFLVEQEGYVVIGRGDGYGTLDAIADLDVFLFIIDLQMPHIKGVDLIRRIRRIQKFKDSAILVMSARREVRDVKVALEAGANDYIVKPIDPEVFKTKVLTLAGSMENQWSEFPLPEGEGLTEVNVPLKCRAVSLNEVSINVISKYPFEVGTTCDIEAEVLEKLGILKATVRVKSCSNENGKFSMRLDFVAMEESTRQKIRLYCRQLAIKARAG
jgi:DNA-binding response OmpR family regulator